MKRLVALLMIASLLCCFFVGTAYATGEITAAPEESSAAVEDTTAASEEATEATEAVEETEEATEPAVAETATGAVEKSEGGMGVVKVVLLVMQIISCLALTAVILFQSSKESGLGALSGNADNYLGKKNAGTLDAKLARMTKWIAAGFVLLTLFVSMLYTAV